MIDWQFQKSAHIVEYDSWMDDSSVAESGWRTDDSSVCRFSSPPQFAHKYFLNTESSDMSDQTVIQNRTLLFDSI